MSDLKEKFAEAGSVATVKIRFERFHTEHSFVVPETGLSIQYIIEKLFLKGLIPDHFKESDIREINIKYLP
jgi:hypothetical protein